MKKIALTLGALAAATSAYSQGTINFSDYQVSGNNAWSISIFEPAVAGSLPANNTLGNTPNDIPAGTATYAGYVLAGTGVEVGLYVGATPSAVTAAITSGTPNYTTTLQTGGYWTYNSDTVALANASGTVYSAIAAWTTTTGSPTSYATALAAGDEAGYSVVSTTTTVLGGVGTPPPPPGNLIGSGITDLAIGSVPEPSTIALGVMGASAFLMRLRRK